MKRAPLVSKRDRTAWVDGNLTHQLERQFGSRNCIEHQVAARRIGEGIIDSVEQLRTFPKSGRVVPETSEECVREVLYSPYRIVYELHDQEGSISIVRVWHAARGSIEWT